MKFKNFVFALSLAVFALAAISFASATVDFVSIGGVNQTLNPGASTSAMTFNVQATSFGGQIENATIVLPNIFGASTVWSGSNSPFTLLPNTNSSQKSFTLAIPAAQAAGSYTGVISLTGAYNISGGLPVINTLPINITVNSYPSLSITSYRDLTKTQSGIINVSNGGNTNFASINLMLSGSYNASLSYNGVSNYNNFALNAGESRLVNITATSPLNNTNLKLGANTLTVNANDTSGVTAASAISYSVSGEYCKNGNANSSYIQFTSLKDTSGKDWEWKPNDAVSIDVKVANNFDSEQDFTVVLGLYDTTTKRFLDIGGDNSDSDTSSNIEQDGITINDGASKTVTFNFNVPLSVESSSGRYLVYIKAYKDGSESTYCNSDYAYNIMNSNSQTAKDLVIKRKSRELSFTDIPASDIVQAGETVTVPIKLYNIGTTDEDRVRVRVANTKLGLVYETDSIAVNSEEFGLFDLTFAIPQNIADGTYTFGVQAFYNYKSDSDTYANSVSDSFSLRIAGGTNPSTVNATVAKIEPSLGNKAVAGSDLTINTRITNTGAKSATFAINARGYDSWATLSSISDRTITLAAGESKDITIKLKLSSSASGTQSFFIDASSASKLDSREVEVQDIASSSLLSQLKDSLNNNSMIWIIGAINVLLILLIVFVIARIARR